jgi:hypothetical protein
LAAALAEDYTKVAQLVFVRGQEERLWVGLVDPSTARERLAEAFPEYERYYRDIRNMLAAGGDPKTPLNKDREITQILTVWPHKFVSGEDQVKQIVTEDLLRQWLGADLDADALPHGPLTSLLRYQVNLRPRRYTALTTDGRLLAVVDKCELATRTTDELLRRQLA